MSKAGSPYFKVLHELWDHPIYKRLSAEQFRVFITLIHLANHRDSVVVGKDGVEFTVPVGSMIYTQEQIASASRTKRQVVRTTLSLLQKNQISNQTSNHGLSVITLRNFATIQHGHLLANQRSNQSLTSPQPVLNQSLALSKEHNNITTYQELHVATRAVSRARSVCNFPDNFPGRQIAARWMDSLSAYQDQTLRTKNLPLWLDTLDKLHRVDGHSWEAIAKLVDWIIADKGDGGSWPGWHRNCQSPAKLRKPNRDGVPYFLAIQARMDEGARPSKANAAPCTDVAAFSHENSLKSGLPILNRKTGQCEVMRADGQIEILTAEVRNDRR